MKKAAILLLAGAQLLAVTGFWLWSHTRHEMGNLLVGDAPDQVLAWARLAGLLATLAVLFQLALVGRVRWVEQTFGMDRLTRLHHVAGFALVLLLLIHPALATLGHAMQAEAGFLAQSADFLKSWEGLPAAYAGTALFLMAGAMSVLVLAKRLDYQRWYLTHLTLYVAFALTVLHQVSVGGDLTGHRGFRLYWYALYAGVALAFLAYRVGRPLAAFARHRFTVEGIVPEAGDVTSVYIGGKNMAAFQAEAGQFLIVRFLARGFRWEAHPFSLSRPPDGRCLRLSIKRLGDYTRRVPDLKPGTPVLIDGPHGIFTAKRCGSRKALLIAGGIGITPIRSIAEELVKADRECLLVYANRNSATMVFKEELEKLAARSGGRLTLVPVMSDEPSWVGEKGRVDRALLSRLAPDAPSRDVFLCGPPPMMKGLRAALAEMGVAAARIHDERFAL